MCQADLGDLLDELPVPRLAVFRALLRIPADLLLQAAQRVLGIEHCSEDRLGFLRLPNCDELGALGPPAVEAFQLEVEAGLALEDEMDASLRRQPLALDVLLLLSGLDPDPIQVPKEAFGVRSTVPYWKPSGRTATTRVSVRLWLWRVVEDDVGELLSDGQVGRPPGIRR